LRAAAGVVTAALVAPHRLFIAAVGVCNVVLGWDGWADLARASALAVVGPIRWRIAICAMSCKLVD
jgi:membrane glycosyltransferase